MKRMIADIPGIYGFQANRYSLKISLDTIGAQLKMAARIALSATRSGESANFHELHKFWKGMMIPLSRAKL